MKNLIVIVPTLALSGCAMTEWMINNADTAEKIADGATIFGPYGAIVGASITAAIGLAKWIEHKNNGKDLIKSIEKAKSQLDDKALAILHDGLQKHMPSKLKKLVSKVKKKL